MQSFQRRKNATLKEGWPRFHSSRLSYAHTRTHECRLEGTKAAGECGCVTGKKEGYGASIQYTNQKTADKLLSRSLPQHLFSFSQPVSHIATTAHWTSRFCEVFFSQSARSGADSRHCTQHDGPQFYVWVDCIWTCSTSFFFLRLHAVCVCLQCGRRGMLSSGKQTLWKTLGCSEFDIAPPLICE